MSLKGYTMYVNSANGRVLSLQTIGHKVIAKIGLEKALEAYEVDLGDGDPANLAFWIGLGAVNYGDVNREDGSFN